jgi:hypothetical protein
MQRKQHQPPGAVHPPESGLAQAPQGRVSAISDLIRKRRRIALSYRRSRSDADLHKLHAIDLQLAGYNIDIPAIQHSVAQRKG